MYQAVKKGIISYQIIRDLEIYERFEAMTDIKHNDAKYLILSDEYELSAARIEQIIYAMNK